MRTAITPFSAFSTPAFKPFLDNKGTVGSGPKPLSLESTPSIEERQLKVSCNRKRSNRVSSLKRKAIGLIQQTRKMMLDRELTEQQQAYLLKLDKNLGGCASHSLYRQHLSNGALEYIGSHTCDQ